MLTEFVMKLKDFLYVFIVIIILFGTFIMLDVSHVDMASLGKKRLVKTITLESYS